MEQQVTKEDQKYINEFSRKHQKNKLFELEIKSLKEKLDNIKDATSNIGELFGEDVKIMIGETFVEVSEDKAAEIIKSMKEKYEATKKDFEERIIINKKRLDELKIILYSKFKNSINLDE